MITIIAAYFKNKQKACILNFILNTGWKLEFSFPKCEPNFALHIHTGDVLPTCYSAIEQLFLLPGQMSWYCKACVQETLVLLNSSHKAQEQLREQFRHTKEKLHSPLSPPHYYHKRVSGIWDSVLKGITHRTSVNALLCLVYYIC